MILWVVWFERNRIFHGEVPTRASMIVEVMLDLLHSFHKFFDSARQLVSVLARNACWTKPLMGSLKLNIDAVVRKWTGWDGIGSVIRDLEGTALACFSKLIKGSWWKTVSCSPLKKDLPSLFVTIFKLAWWRVMRYGLFKVSNTNFL
ncbi:hypothetical protein TorRG33x02_157960 [Trema orientale]|uniref:Reverse transcriptase zinc-binding domain-containing protein n=1 Tax=Trema orientale TaxID=63057 RepID=A0A2P5ESA4_TREOI|nr:hypothetical protein TorRG33x02_157960 [Trema orientale]